MKKIFYKNNFWDDKYKANEYIYGKKPNKFLKNILEEFQPGKILLPADGEGRNSVYAAKKGWNVTAFDSSIIAKQKAEKLAEEKNVNIKYISKDIFTFKTNEKFNLISIIYLHLPANIRLEFHKKMLTFLEKGGHLIMECFSKLQINNNSGGPKDIDLLYNIEDLKTDFLKSKIKLIEEKETILDEGELHQGKANVIQVIIQKN